MIAPRGDHEMLKASLVMSLAAPKRRSTKAIANNGTRPGDDQAGSFC